VVRAKHHLADQIDSGGYAAHIIPNPKKRHEVRLGDIERRDVWECAFQAITNLDKHFVILDEHKEHHAVAALLLTNAPGLCHALGVVGDIRVALHLGKNRHHDLIESSQLKFR